MIVLTAHFLVEQINFTEMEKNIFVIFTILLGIVVVILLFTIATLQSENSDLRNVVRNQANQISEADRYYNNVVARGMYADDPVYKALDRSNTKIQVNMNKIIPYNMLTGRSSLLQVHQLYLREIKTKEHLHWRKQVIKTHNMSIANRKSHNYAVQLLVKATNIPYSVELAKLMNLIINGKFTQRKMYYVSIDTAIFKLINNLTI